MSEDRDRFIYRFLLPGLIIWGIDFLTKAWARSLPLPILWGPMQLYPAQNPIWTFASLPIGLRIVSIATASAFLVFVVSVVQYFLPARAKGLALGLSIWLGAVLGNALDRIQNGTVTAFVAFRTSAGISRIFNFADLAQWVGLALITGGLIFGRKLYWRKGSLRRSYIVDRDYQYRFCMMLFSVALGFAVIVGAYSYSFLKFSFPSDSPAQAMIDEQILPYFLTAYVALSLVFLLIIAVLGLVLSNRVAGPIFSFKRHVRALLSGKKPGPLKLRSKDEFRELEDVASQIEGRLSERRSTPPPFNNPT